MTSFLNALPSAVAQGLIWGIMAIGVYITYRLLDVSDLTVDGSFCTGGAVCAVMIVAGYNVWLSMAVAFVVSVLVIRFLMNYIRSHDFKVFGWYRIILGLIVIIYFTIIRK